MAKYMKAEIEYAKQEAEQVDSFISELVNDSSSRFYIHG